jgi:hypothetical protein
VLSGCHGQSLDPVRHAGEELPRKIGKHRTPQMQLRFMQIAAVGSHPCVAFLPLRVQKSCQKASILE